MIDGLGQLAQTHNIYLEQSTEVTTGAQAIAAIDSYAEEGFDLVIAHSSLYRDAVGQSALF